jgi:pimeloyl-ACP methyl ester carboxylesterase
MPFYHIHPNPTINFQLGRVLTYGDQAGYLDEVKEIAYRVRNFDTWFVEWMALAQRAEREGRLLHAAWAYRMAEFFLTENNPEKNRCYEQFRQKFYGAFDENDFHLYQVPYEGTSLPVIYIPAEHERAVIVVHGGYDSFIEEFYLSVRDFAKFGYSIYLFEGPGQGRLLRDGLKMTPEWEKPVKAVLDYFHLEDVILLGVSLGGYLATRAAAFEPRISKLICYDVCYNFFDGITRWMPSPILGLFKLLFGLRIRWGVNALISQLMRRNLGIQWLVSHGMYILGVATPFEYYQKIARFTVQDIGHLVKQDCLLLAGEKDHYIPIRHFALHKAALRNAHSITGRVFTHAEGGEQHCQIGNIALAIDTIRQWLDGFYGETKQACQLMEAMR